MVIDGVDVTPPAPKERALLALLVISARPGGRRRSAHGGALADAAHADRRGGCCRSEWPSVRKLLEHRRRNGRAPRAGGTGLPARPSPTSVVDRTPVLRAGRAGAASRRGPRPWPRAVGDAPLRRSASGEGEPLADVQACVNETSRPKPPAWVRHGLGVIEDRIDADLACGRHLAVACGAGRDW